MFELIADQPGTFGILFAPSGKVVGRTRSAWSREERKQEASG